MNIRQISVEVVTDEATVKVTKEPLRPVDAASIQAETERTIDEVLVHLGILEVTREEMKR